MSLEGSTIRPGLVRRPMFWLVVLLTGLTCYRFSTIGSGHFYAGDESRYFAAERLVDDLSAGDHRAAAGRLFEVTVRPAFVLISVIPAAAQRLVGGVFGLERQTHAYYDTVAGFNVLVALGVAFCVFALVRRWTASGWYALLATVLFSWRVCANIWVRHLVPYYESLLLFLVALLLVTPRAPQADATNRRMCAAGLLSALGFTCYPGFYTFVLINAAVVVVVARRRIAAVVCFGASAAAVLSGFELVSRWAGQSYFKNLLGLPHEHARLMKIGLCEEGYVFIWRYLCDVEGAAGVVLLALCAVFVGLVVCRRGASIPRAARAAILAAIVCYLIHATQATLRHKVAVYGRVMVMYVPFMVCGAVLVLRQIRWPRLRIAAVCGVLLVSGASFVSFARWYSSVRYPEDLFFETIAAEAQPGEFSPNVLWTGVGGKLNRSVERDASPLVAMVAEPYPDGFYSYYPSHQAAAASGARYIGVNLKWVRDIPEERHHFKAPPGYRLIFEDAATFAHPPMAYEERGARERELLSQHDYSMRIYERIDPLQACTGDEHAGSAPVNSPG